MDLTPKFVKWISRDECGSNELIVPHAFCVQHARFIPCTVKLIVHNEYALWLNFDKVKESFLGMRLFFAYFSMVPGQTLLLEYCGGFDFKVCIFNLDGSEIAYPKFVNDNLNPEVDEVCVEDVGFRFIKHFGWGRKVVDEVPVPLQRFRSVLPRILEFVITGGIRIVGFYDAKDWRIKGLVSLCNLLGVSCLNGYNLLSFKFDGVSTFSMCTFHSSLIEAPLTPHPSMFYIF